MPRRQGKGRGKRGDMARPFERFDEGMFRRSVATALDTVTRVLDATRNPILPHKAEHCFGDKFGIAEAVTNRALAALLNTIEARRTAHPD